MAAGESGLDEELAALTFEIEGGSSYSSSSNGGGQEGGLVPRDGRRGGGRSMAPGSKNVVCIHYLVGMCALDKDCPYLHQYDLDRVPICPYVGREEGREGGGACHAMMMGSTDLWPSFSIFFFLFQVWQQMCAGRRLSFQACHRGKAGRKGVGGGRAGGRRAGGGISS
jgi:hypothetical protein